LSFPYTTGDEASHPFWAARGDKPAAGIHGRLDLEKESIMASDYKIKVTYSDGQLTIEDPRDLELNEDTPTIHSAVWNFEGIDDLAATYHPGLEFEGPSSVTEQGTKLYSGPFIDLGHTPTSIIACGNNGKPGRFSYRAILEDPKSGSIIRSANQGKITNQVKGEKPAIIKVFFVSEKEPLRVEPETVTLTSGQSLLWEVVEKPEDIAEWYPRLLFEEGNPYFGPFGTVTTRDKTILGTGSGSGSEPASYGYRFQMVSVEDGQVLFASSPDPIVDDEGDPTGTQTP
jgi:hypothetical protein